MNTEELKQAYSEIKIAVVGDFILDEWWKGTVTRLNPEAPVPVVLNPVKTINLGGAGNVCVQLKKLGAWVAFYAIGGVDDAAKAVLAFTHKNGLVGYYFHDGKYNTPHKLRVIGNDQHIVRVDSESTVTSQSVDEQLLAEFMKNVGVYDAVIMSDYNKGVLQKHQIRALMKVCNEADVPVFVDPKKDNFWEYGGATIIKCNKAEVLAQCDGGDEIDAVGVRNLFKMKMSEPVMNVVTLGSQGYWAIDQTGDWTYGLVPDVSVVETSGAGDIFLAVLVLEWLRLEKLHPVTSKEFPLFQAARLANRAGAIVVQKPGIAHCTVEELCGEVTDG